MQAGGQHHRRLLPHQRTSFGYPSILVTMFLLNLLLLTSLVHGSTNVTVNEPDTIQDRKDSVLEKAMEAVSSPTVKGLIKSLKQRRLQSRKSIGIELLDPGELTEFFSLLQGSKGEKESRQTKAISLKDVVNERSLSRRRSGRLVSRQLPQHLPPPPTA